MSKVERKAMEAAAAAARRTAALDAILTGPRRLDYNIALRQPTVRAVHHELAPLFSVLQHPSLPVRHRPTSVAARGKQHVDHILYSPLPVAALLRANEDPTATVSVAGDGHGGGSSTDEAAEEDAAAARALARYSCAAPLLVCHSVYELPTDQELFHASFATPNFYEGSDHLPVAARFRWQS
jgi:hypothetical protein